MKRLFIILKYALELALARVSVLKIGKLKTK